MNRRFSHYLDRSTLNSIVVGLPLAAIVIVVASIALYQFSSARIEQRGMEQLQQSATQAAALNQTRIDWLWELSDLLASNHLVINSLIDVQGIRDNLTPLISSIRLPSADGKLTVVDYRGRPLASNHPDKHLPLPDQLRHYIENGLSHSLLDNDHHLHFITPIAIDGFREGAVVISLSKDELLMMLNIGVGNHQLAIVDLQQRPLLINHYDRAVLQQLLDGDPQWLVTTSEIVLNNRTPALLISAQPKRLALAALKEQRRSIMVIAGASLIIVLLGILLTTLHIRRKLKKLSLEIELIRRDYPGNHQIEAQGPQEITQIASAFAQLTEQLSTSIRTSKQDPLTRLANRGEFDAALEREWRSASRRHAPLSLLMIDIDHFKAYNDHFGHQQGDRCLQAVAQVIGNCARRAGDLSFRYGGEEFAILLPQTNSALPVARQLLFEVEQLRQPHPKSASCDWVTISIGVATLYPSYQHQANELVAMADSALYSAKETGRNRFVYHNGHRSDQAEEQRQPRLHPLN